MGKGNREWDCRGGRVITLCRLLFNHLAFKDFLWKIQVVSK